jgi:hypothetical protein
MNRASLILGLGLLGYVGCASFEASFCDYGFCSGTTDGGPDGSTTDSSTDAGRDADPPPPGCDTPNEPLKNPEKCLVDSFGAFVSPTGDDGNPGTKAKPFKTIGKALAGEKTRIAVCEGTFQEALEVKRDVEIYSGIDCTFARPGSKAAIAPDATIGIVVTQGALSLFDVSIVAKSAVANGESSVGVLARPGTTLTLTRSTITAGAGAAGAEPDASPTNHLLAADLDGKSTTVSTGAGINRCTCPKHGTSAGAPGGSGGVDGNPGGQKGGDGTASPSATTSGVFTGEGGAGDPNGASGCRLGVSGSPGSARAGGAGATKVGVAGVTGWIPGSGSPGEAGNPGQGGGGGGGGYYVASSMGGGGGACGGCGGAAGNGGGGGGASIAILAIDAAVVATGSSLTTSKGGPGKSGNSGQDGSAGGAPGSGACNGGRGGAGAGGGGGGGGAGGISVGIAFTGTAPSVDGQSLSDAAAHPGFLLGAAGEPGGGGSGGKAVTVSVPPGIAGEAGKNGVPGLSKAVMKVDK